MPFFPLRGDGGSALAEIAARTAQRRGRSRSRGSSRARRRCCRSRAPCRSSTSNQNLAALRDRAERRGVRGASVRNATVVTRTAPCLYCLRYTGCAGLTLKTTDAFDRKPFPGADYTDIKALYHDRALDDGATPYLDYHGSLRPVCRGRQRAWLRRVSGGDRRPDVADGAAGGQRDHIPADQRCRTGSGGADHDPAARRPDRPPGLSVRGLPAARVVCLPQLGSARGCAGSGRHRSLGPRTARRRRRADRAGALPRAVPGRTGRSAGFRPAARRRAAVGSTNGDGGAGHVPGSQPPRAGCEPVRLGTRPTASTACDGRIPTPSGGGRTGRRPSGGCNRMCPPRNSTSPAPDSRF